MPPKCGGEDKEHNVEQGQNVAFVHLSGPLDKVRHGYRDDESPVGGHDVGIRGGKTHADMQEHVEEERQQSHPHQPLAYGAEQPECEEGDDSSLGDVFPIVAITYDYRARILRQIGIFEQMSS